MMDVIRLAKANNPALVHCSNVWAKRNNEVNPVVTIRKVLKMKIWFFIWFVIAPLTLSTITILNMTTWTEWLLKHNDIGFALMIGLCVVVFIMLWATVCSINIGIPFTIHSYKSDREKWISAKRFMKAMTFLEDAFGEKITRANRRFIWWEDPIKALRIASQSNNSPTVAELKNLAKETMELQEIPWRSKEAKAKRAEFEEFLNTMKALLDIPVAYEVYFTVMTVIENQQTVIDVMKKQDEAIAKVGARTRMTAPSTA